VPWIPPEVGKVLWANPTEVAAEGSIGKWGKSKALLGAIRGVHPRCIGTCSNASGHSSTNLHRALHGDPFL
jgi:hypothetical protein